MNEHHRKRLIPRSVFFARMLRHLAAAVTLLFLSLGVGMAGYEHYEHLPWRDAFVNAAMLLGGMGPVDALRTDGGKVFAGCFALYAGLVFLFIAGLLLAPVIHRILQHYHWEGAEPRP